MRLRRIIVVLFTAPEEESAPSAARAVLPPGGAAMLGIVALALVWPGVVPASRVAMLRGMFACLL